MNEFKIAWDADHNFVRSNMHRVWNAVDLDQLDKAAALWRRASRGQEILTQILTESIESREFDGPRPVVGPKRRGQPARNTEDFGARVTITPESLWGEGHYSACEATLRQGRASLSLARTLLLAQCSFYSGNYENSLRAADAALRIEPHSLAALYWKAKSAQELAAAALHRTSSVAPGSPRVHLLLAELHRAKQEFDAAEVEYQQVIESANEPSAHLGLAHVYYQKSQDEKSLAELQYVFEADAKNADASLLMAEIFVKRHRYEEAVPYLKDALRGSPLSVPRVHSLLARCYADQGQYSQALVELKPALPADTTGIFHYQLYQLYEKLGNHKGAMVALQVSERLRREEADAELGLKRLPIKNTDSNR
jgi:tetratricopeptide (TPR) repeat protein